MNELNKVVVQNCYRPEEPQEAFPGNGKQKVQDAEIARLRKEVAKLKMERDILNKAAAYFARESM